ncbi:MAG: tRNA(Met) cytidine acetyltransferase [Oceanospirillaceae bacterium]|jgi:tRNA(Met) cytidine acetyltransferase
MRLENIYQQCARKAAAHSHRQLLWLSGEQNWCYQQLITIKSVLLAQSSIAIFSRDVIAEYFNEAQHNALSATQIDAKDCYKYLGAEHQLIIFDGYSGFNPDSLAQISGTLSAGGVLILLTPEIGQWQNWQEPELDNLWVQPFTLANVSRYFLDWLKNSLVTCTQLAQFSQAALTRPIPPKNTHSFNTTSAVKLGLLNSVALQKQHQFVSKSADYILKNSDAVIVLTAARGRGKSAALGLLAQQLTSHKTLYITAARKQAIQQVEKFSDTPLVYLSPQVLLNVDFIVQENAILMVDEAASISVDVLLRLTEKFRQVIFSTTTQGYEGTGQGFNLRFVQYLKRKRSSVKEFTLELAMRWAENDPLERWINKLLFLEHNISPFNNQQVKADSGKACSIVKISSSELLEKPKKLQQLFSLLSQAHYRTTPNDLRIILDSPNMHLWIAIIDNQVIAACLVAIEGAFKDFTDDNQGMAGEQLALAMYRGLRRPRGNLLPQVLIAQEGYLAARNIKVARIVRIATAFGFRHQGIAARLLDTVNEWAQQISCDYVGANFSLQQDLILFWEKQNYTIVRVGNQLDKVTASYSATVLKALKTDHVLLNQLKTSFDRRLTFQLQRIFEKNTLSEFCIKHLDNSLNDKELRSQVIPNENWCVEQLNCFCHYHRPFASIAYIMQFMLKQHPSGWHEAAIGAENNKLLQNYFFDMVELSKIYKQFSLSGYRSLTSRFKQLTSVFLHNIKADLD